jgi:hypothetical protein
VMSYTFVPETGAAATLTLALLPLMAGLTY